MTILAQAYAQQDNIVTEVSNLDSIGYVDCDSLLINGTEIISDDRDITCRNLTCTIQTTLEEVAISNNRLVLNSDQTGTPSSGLTAGLEIERGSSPNYMLLFRESDDSFVIGLNSDLQSVSTRQDTPADTAIAYWNDTAKRFDTNAAVTIAANRLTTSSPIVISGTKASILTAANANIVIAPHTAASITSGLSNIVLSEGAGVSITSGSHNIAIGVNTLAGVTSTGANLAIGAESLRFATGTGNVAVGLQVLPSLVAGDGNTSLGVYAMPSFTTGSNNTAIGTNSGFTRSQANRSLAIGANSDFGSSGSPANNVTLLGYAAGTGIVAADYDIIIGNDLSINNQLIRGSAATGARHWSPAVDAAIDLGVSGRAWRDLLVTRNINSSAFTASTILAADGSKNAVSLSTATYPSLAELAYVKDVTSSIQTQIDNTMSFVAANGLMLHQATPYTADQLTRFYRYLQAFQGVTIKRFTASMLSAGSGTSYQSIGAIYNPITSRFHMINAVSGNSFSYMSTHVSNTVYTSSGTFITDGVASGIYSPLTGEIFLVPYAQSNTANWYSLSFTPLSTTATTNTLTNIPSIPTLFYWGGSLDPINNRVYYCPTIACDGSTNTQWHYADVLTRDVVAYTHGATTVVNCYRGSVYDPVNHRIWLVPHGQANQTTWHYINCSTGAVVGYTHGATCVAGAYQGGVYSPIQRRIYFVPLAQANQASWHYINLDTGAIVSYTHGATCVADAYSGGCYSPTLNYIFLAPYSQSNQSTWHYINCDTGAVVGYDHGFGAIAQYAFNGCVWNGSSVTHPPSIYFVESSIASASNHNRHVLFETSRNEGFSHDLPAHASFNKF